MKKEVSAPELTVAAIIVWGSGIITAHYQERDLVDIGVPMTKTSSANMDHKFISFLTTGLCSKKTTRNKVTFHNLYNAYTMQNLCLYYL